MDEMYAIQLMNEKGHVAWITSRFLTESTGVLSLSLHLARFFDLYENADAFLESAAEVLQSQYSDCKVTIKKITYSWD